MSIACRVAGSQITTHNNVQSRRNVVVSEEGEVFVWGNMRDPGYPPIDRPPQKGGPVKLKNLPKIVMVSCGDMISAVVGDDGSLWTWGSTTGSGHTLLTSLPTQVPRQEFNDCVVMVACGTAHTIALTASGQVFTCGDGSDGALGLGTNDNVRRFSVVATLTAMAPTPCIMVAAGAQHSVVLEASGTVWTFGSGVMGALGQGHFREEATPRRLRPFCDAGQHVEMVAAGGANTAVVTSAGVLWTWGSGTFGQLGVPLLVGAPLHKCDPQRVTMPLCAGSAITNQVLTVSCGTFHTLMLKRNGSLWGCGQNTHGELSPTSLTGHPRALDYVFTPRLLGPTFAGRKFVSVFATFRGSSAVDEFGDLVQWGAGMTGGGPDPYVGLPKTRLLPSRIGRCHELSYAMVEALCMGAMARLAIRDQPPHCAMRNGFDNQDVFRTITPLCISWPEGVAGNRLRSMPGLMRWIGAYVVRQSRF